MDALTYQGLGLFDDPSVAQIENDIETGQEWLLKFVDINRYDWNDPAFTKRNKGSYAFLPIPLSQGFFFIVPKWAYKKMTVHPDGRPKSWAAKIDRDKHTGKILKVYARRAGRKIYGEPKDVYASRELLDLLSSRRDVDHVNRWTLDNRCTRNGGINLQAVSVRLNMANSVPRRRKNHELLRGVERKGVSKDGEQMYGGIFARRVSKKRAIVTRSKRRWTSQQPAHQWYCNQMRRRFKREEWAFDQATLNYPIFPPLMESERCMPVRKRAKVFDDGLAATF